MLVFLQTVQNLIVGEDPIAIGLSAKPFYSWEQERQQAFTQVVEVSKYLHWSPEIGNSGSPLF